MRRKKLVSRIQTPDGTILTSHHVHDYVTYTDKNGELYMLDGGCEYTRTTINKEPAIDCSVYTNSPFEDIRKYLCRGTYDKNLNLIWKPLCECSDNHLKNILLYEKEHNNSQSIFCKMVRKEIRYRKKNHVIVNN